MLLIVCLVLNGHLYLSGEWLGVCLCMNIERQVNDWV